MKKLLAIILVLAIIAGCVFYFVPSVGQDCGGKIREFFASIGIGEKENQEAGEEHAHNYQTGWSYDGEYHWHACTGSCESVSDKAEHSYEWKVDQNPTSSQEGTKHEECVCGAKRSEGTSISKLPTSAPTGSVISRTQFYKALSFEGITSYVINLEADDFIYDDNYENILDTKLFCQKAFVQDNKAYFTFPDNSAPSYFAEGVYDGTYIYELHGSTYRRYKVNETDIAMSPEVLKNAFINYGQINFDDFVYIDGVYYGTMKGNSGTKMDVQLVFNNDLLVYCNVKQVIQGYDIRTIMMFSGYNATTVNLPKNFITAS